MYEKYYRNKDCFFNFSSISSQTYLLDVFEFYVILLDRLLSVLVNSDDVFCGRSLIGGRKGQFQCHWQESWWQER